MVRKEETEEREDSLGLSWGFRDEETRPDIANSLGLASWDKLPQGVALWFPGNWSWEDLEQRRDGHGLRGPDKGGLWALTWDQVGLCRKGCSPRVLLSLGSPPRAVRPPNVKASKGKNKKKIF